MAPIATTPDSSSTGTTGTPSTPFSEGGHGFFNGNDRHTNGHGSNGHTNGHANGSSNHHYPPAKTMPIAIVGMACRMPGNVATPSEFWELLSRARTGFTEIPQRRFNPAAFYHPNPGKGGAFNAVGGNFLDVDLAAFDAPFFGLTEKEAISMDPQQRLLLECTFEALESAGVPKHTIVGKDVGVFVGGSFPEYESHLFRDSDTIPMHQATGCAYAMQSNRISHFFDLRGPSFTADTACSASMVAMHQACQSLRLGESSIALAGGCHLNMLPEFWISFSTCRLLADSGRSIAFDDRGTGFGRGEGCGMLVLKPLDQAIRDGDPVRAVIAGTGINQDGKTPGITMPNGEAQEALMRQVYAKNGLDPKDCGFVEAHGTGTRVGDPIEATALHNVLGQDRSAKNPLLIGSVKSNIGHLEAASGIAGVIKAALMLERGFVLPNHNFKTPNPKIPWKDWNMKILTMQRPWPKGKKYISVNNFGFGGTNGHVVLEAAPFKQRAATAQEAKDKAAENTRRLFVFTANDKAALSALMKNTVIYLEQRPEVFQAALLDDLSYTLGQRRSFLQWKTAISATDSFELIEALNNEKSTPGKEIEPLRIGFIFTGQGAQWHAMGRELYDQFPIYARSIDHADRCLAALGAEWSLRDELNRDAKESKVGEAHLSQPACTAVQLALVDLLSSWGVHPTAVAGHSSGEIGAAYAAGSISFEAAVAVAYHRGRLIPILKKKHPELQGRMMAVGGTKEEIAPIIEGLQEKEARIACYNSPSSLTISGDEPAVAELEKIMEEKQVFNRRLVVETAYHSHHMNLVAKEYRASILKLGTPVNTDVKVHSSLHGRLADGTDLGPQYWVDNLTKPVRFSEALQSMLESDGEHKTGVNMLVELGPHSALQGPIKQVLKAVGGAAAKIPYVSALIRKKNAVDTVLDVATSLFSKGATLDFGAINFPKPGKQPTTLTDLPRYPWNYSNKYWQESRMTEKHKNRKALRSDILGSEAIYSHDLEPTWRNIVRIDDLPWLRHHTIQSLNMFPMAGFIVMALEAAAQRAASREISVDKYELKDVSVTHPLVITDEDVEMTINLRPHQEAGLVSSDIWDEFRICSWSSTKGWTEHCIGLVAVQVKDANVVDGERQKLASKALLQSTIEAIQSAGASSVKSSELYDRLADMGVAYGPTFQGIQDCQACDNISMGTISVQDVAKDMPNHHMVSPMIHPSFLESLIEMYWPILGATQSNANVVYLPSSVSRVSVSHSVLDTIKEPGSTLKAYCKGDLPQETPKASKISVYATSNDDTMEPLIALEDLVVSPVIDGETVADVNAPRELCFKTEWEPILRPLEHAANGEAATNGVAKLPDTQVAIVHEESDFQTLVAMGLATELEQLTGRQPEFGSLQQVDAAGKILIFLPEIHQPILSTLSEDQFTALQKSILAAEGVLWLTRGASNKSTNPDANMVAGLSRAIRSETAMKFATLDLDAQTPQLSEVQTAKAIVEVFRAAFGSEASNTSELEFMERAGSFYTPRIINDKEMNSYVHKQTNPSVLEPTSFGHGDRHLKLALSTPGGLETLHFLDDNSAEEPLAADQVEVEVKAVGLNQRDVMTVKGQVTGDLGVEASGTVTAVGSNVSDFQVGDRVAALTSGAFATCTRTIASNVFKIPSDVSFEAAASLPLAYVTAYHSLVELGRLSGGESVLIHAASGAVGQAAITLAQMVGAKVFATVGSAEKKQLLMAEYQMPEEHIFYSRNTSFGNGIRQITKNEGVDVILNSLTGDLLQESWACLSKYGRFIDIGKRDTTHKTRLEMPHADRNASFTTVDMFGLLAERPKQVKRLVYDVSRLLNWGKIRPAAPITTFPISDVETAFKTMQNSRTEGKLVIVPHADDIVKAPPSKRLNNLLKSDATYILIGGTGGLGRSMTRWMVEKGAKNIVLISRSGSATGKVKDLVDDMTALGANILVKPCNVVNRTQVDGLIASLKELPPIRGVVHGTMVLHDVLYEKMTFDEYTTVIEGKVQGGWNFHHALADAPLDFFVAISSAAGAVGNRGQAAYAAANCFLNALVQHRLANGLPASSLDLTMVSDSGYLADKAEKLAEVARNLGSDSICESEVLALLSAAINGRLGETCNNHTITGMRITAAMQPFWTADAKFKHLRIAMEEAAAADASLKAGAISFKAALKLAKTSPEAETIVCNGLVDKISAVLMLEAEDMDVTRSLSHYPLDSLVAIEIRNFITREFEANMQVLELLSSGSIQTLAKAVVGKSKIVAAAA